MAPMDAPLTAEMLAAHGDWLRRLAAHLLAGAPDADDAVQATWEATLRSPPDPDRPARPWLAQVLRNAIRTHGRTARRRRTHETAAALAPDAATGADDVLARLQLQERIARLMAGLEEPYRTTLLQRFYDGQDATEIARACGVPAGTVRWRISEGIRRLRERLDQQPGGREGWRAVLVPLVGEGRPRAGTPWLLPTVGAAAAVMAGAVALLVTTRVPPPPRAAPTALADRLQPRSQPAQPAAAIISNEEETMRGENLKRAAAFLSVVLPALVAGAEERPDPLFEQGVNLCVQLRERLYECKEAFADAVVARKQPPPDRREALRRKVIEEITDDGSGPLEPRRQKCAAMAIPGKLPPTEKAGLDRLKQGLDECTGKPDCTARVACLSKLLPQGGNRRPAP